MTTVVFVVGFSHCVSSIIIWAGGESVYLAGDNGRYPVAIVSFWKAS